MALLKIAKKRPVVTAVIAAAGLSERMGGEDKLFLEINGAPVLAHSLIVFQGCACIDEIVVVTREEKMGLVSNICSQYGIEKAVRVMAGGKTRLESVLIGVLAVSKKSHLVAIHDGARPCISAETVDSTVAAAVKFHAAAPGVPVSSTLKSAKDGVILGTVAREGVFEIQTPQVFDTDLIKAALVNAAKKSIEVTDDCAAAEIIGVPVRITEGARSNIKLTTSDDVAMAEMIIRYMKHR